jgi:hypothetical protein
MTEHLVNLILDMKDEMERLDLKTDENNKIINTFLLQYCVHEVVRDDIDISLDRSMTIFYCNKCNVSLQSKI